MIYNTSSDTSNADPHISASLPCSFATRDQELLLRASLLQGPDAVRAWRAWKSSVDLEGQFDNGSFRLLPLLYMNLGRLGIDDPFMNRLKGIYRQAWSKNQQLFFQISRIVRCLQEVGIRTIVLKGAALTVLAYRNHGVRPMADIDLLVHPSQTAAAVDLLKQAGWMPTSEMTAGDLVYRHSKQLKDAPGKELDLHWHLLFESCRLDADDEFWNNAMPMQIHDVDTLSLDPTDMFFHVIVHGAQWNPEPPIRWIADAIAVLRSSPDGIDPVRLMRHVGKHKVRLRMREALNYLDELFPGTIPEPVRAGIRRVQPTPLERFEFRFIAHDYGSYYDSVRGNFVIALLEYQRLRRDTGFLSSLLGFPRYLQYRLGLKDLPHLSRYIASGVVKKCSSIIKTFIRNRLSSFRKEPA